jgi:hypothetical protein
MLLNSLQKNLKTKHNTNTHNFFIGKYITTT